MISNTILAIVLTASNILVYVNLQNQINTLETDNTTLYAQTNTLQSQKSDLETQVGNLTSEKDDLQDEVNSLKSENSDLQDEVESLETEIWGLEWDIYSLEKAQLHRFDDIWHDLYPEPYINYNGIVFNSGTWTAYDAIVTIRIYDVLINSDEIHLGDIEGKDYQVIDVDVYCQYDPDRVTAALDWD